MCFLVAVAGLPKCLVAAEASAFLQASTVMNEFSIHCFSAPGGSPPPFERMLRQNPTLSAYLDRTDGFVDLPLGKKLQVGALLCVKMVIDGIALLVSLVMRLVKLAERA